MKRARLKPISPKRRSRVGKLGIERKRGEDMSLSRMDVYFRAGGYCQMRDMLVAEILQVDMTPEQRMVATANIVQNCWGWVSTAHGHDAHIRTKRNNGDELDNRIWSCPKCHAASHNAFNKPCPPKPKMESV